MDLLHGENPYQVNAGLFSSDAEDNLSLASLDRVNNNLPCFTNLADLDAILHTLCLVWEAFLLNQSNAPFIAIAAKHGNPCGLGIDWSSKDVAVSRALFGNPQAVWGGEFIVNFEIDDGLAHLLYKDEKRKEILGSPYWMLDLVAAAGFSRKAIEVLGKNTSRKLFGSAGLLEPRLPRNAFSLRQVRGGFLGQPSGDYILDIKKSETGNLNLSPEIIDSLILAWAVANSSFHGGNEIAIAKNRQLIGSGGGPSTLDAAKSAVSRAQSQEHDLDAAVFTADAFFPFTDAPQVLKEAGCMAGIVPSGGKNEELVRKYFTDSKVGVIYLDEQYRGFCRH
jgi:phosphoribosylaminoimidazolecarboxamide formyltransferase/IMP cyclohydrolase